MYVNEKLKLNKFQDIAIPKPSEYIRRYGEMLPKGGSYTGEQVAPMETSKIDALAMADRENAMHLYDEMRQREADAQKGE